MSSDQKKKLEQEILSRKEEMCKTRDACADEYTKYIQLLVESEGNPELYEYYLQKITELEPYTRTTKEKMRELNRELSRLDKKKD